ncbi:fimbrial protein [Salmonella enterica]
MARITDRRRLKGRHCPYLMVSALLTAVGVTILATQPASADVYLVLSYDVQIIADTCNVSVLADDGWTSLAPNGDTPNLSTTKPLSFGTINLPDLGNGSQVKQLGLALFNCPQGYPLGTSMSLSGSGMQDYGSYILLPSTGGINAGFRISPTSSTNSIKAGGTLMNFPVNVQQNGVHTDITFTAEPVRMNTGGREPQSGDTLNAALTMTLTYN